MAAKNTFGPQPFLQGNGQVVAHLQFIFRAHVQSVDLLTRLGHLWDTAVIGDDDPAVEGAYGKSQSPEFGAPSGSIVVGFRPEWWATVDPNGIPKNLSGFTESIQGIDGSEALATQHDLWVWLNQSSSDRLFDSICKVRRVLDGLADLSESRECFTYHNSVTLDGFADGIGNPNAFRAPSVSVIPEGQQGAGGTTVLVQKWLVEVDKMRALKLPEGEAVYGRSKLKGHKLSPLPERSHVARNQFYGPDGKTIDIVRRNAYFGDVKEAGVMFIGFSNNIDVTMGMLKQMYGIGPDRIAKTDALLDFSKAVSSSIYFVPSYDALMRAGVTVLDQP